jgi:hypothetical protein
LHLVTLGSLNRFTSASSRPLSSAHNALHVTRSSLILTALSELTGDTSSCRIAKRNSAIRAHRRGKKILLVGTIAKIEKAEKAVVREANEFHVATPRFVKVLVGVDKSGSIGHPSAPWTESAYESGRRNMLSGRSLCRSR